MLRRYHKKVYIPNNDIKKLQNFTYKLNDINWQYSAHALDNLKYRVYNIKDILVYIKALQLDYNTIFEYYTNDKGDMVKVCYRTNYTKNNDLILVVSDTKKLVTIYINTGDDNHATLKKELYVRN